MMDKRPALTERVFGVTLERQADPREWICRCTEEEIAPLAAAVGRREAKADEDLVHSPENKSGVECQVQNGFRGLESVEAGGAMEEYEHRRQRPFGHGRKRRLAADLERAARRRINGAVGSERAPAHYQALLPMLGCRSRDIRGWRQETGSQLSPWREDGRKTDNSPMTPPGSSVDSVPSPEEASSLGMERGRWSL